MNILGVDIGGSGIKGAVVNTETGELLCERIRIDTPQPATPAAVAEALKALAQQLNWQGPIGCGFPAAIQHGVARTAANIDASWLGLEVAQYFSTALGQPVYVANDADVAAMAEMTFGAGKGKQGVVLLVTIGTGLGTAFFNKGVLFPNTELGHILIKSMPAEHYASDAVRKKEDLSWTEWGRRFDRYLCRMENLFWPDLIILGGGASKKLDKFMSELSVKAPVVPAQFLNQAGIVGAALFALSELPEQQQSNQ